jgi:hypothetical protein
MEPVATPLPLPHRTIRGDDPEARHDGPWLVSYALWADALQYVDAGGITVAALCGRARTTGLLLGGLRRWGYVTVTPPAGAVLMNPPQETACVGTTKSGRQAREFWRPLPAALEETWRARFGNGAVDQLQGTLRAAFELLAL